MGRRRVGEENVRTVTKSGGNSYSVTLPIQVMRGLGWREGQQVVVERAGQRLVVRNHKTRKSS